MKTGVDFHFDVGVDVYDVVEVDVENPPVKLSFDKTPILKRKLSGLNRNKNKVLYIYFVQFGMIFI